MDPGAGLGVDPEDLGVDPGVGRSAGRKDPGLSCGVTVLSLKIKISRKEIQEGPDRP